MSILWNILKYLTILILPFFMLIRGAIYVHREYNLGAYSSLLLATIATTLLLFLYMTFIYLKLTEKLGDDNNLQRRLIFAFLLVAAYCAYGLFFISADNFKSPALKKEIREMHPILRLGVSTFILLDRDLIITDATRRPEDYRKMGLSTAKNSLHYPQKDGYAYALDLRTNRRSSIRNTAMTTYFELLGFNTLRHVGTDDHLHISLHCHYRPQAR